MIPWRKFRRYAQVLARMQPIRLAREDSRNSLWSAHGQSIVSSDQQATSQQQPPCGVLADTPVPRAPNSDPATRYAAKRDSITGRNSAASSPAEPNPACAQSEARSPSRNFTPRITNSMKEFAAVGPPYV